MAVFLFDNDISFRIVNALKELVPPGQHELKALRSEFAENARDIDWIPVAGEKNWIVVSKDVRQKRRPLEREALKKNGVRAIYIRQRATNLEIYAEAARIIRCWPTIAGWGSKAKAGEQVKLTTEDKVEPFNH